MNIRFEDGAELIFSPRFDDYLPAVFTRWEGVECYNYSPLIYANGCENIALTGHGRIVGNGEAWWSWKQIQHDAAKRLYHAEFQGVPVQQRVFANERDALRPYFVQFIDCQTIYVDGLTFVNGPMWTVSPVYCENVLFRNVTIKTNGPNTDGINPESSRNVIIEHCTFDTGDDCIAINSGMNEDGWRVGRPCENILVRHCVMRGGHACVAIGSGVSGGISSVYVHDCDFSGRGQRGIRIKTMPGRGGYVRDIHYENLVISDKQDNAIEITAHYPSSSAPSASTACTEISNIHFTNISGTHNNNTIELAGKPDNHIRNLYFRNIRLEGKTGFMMKNVDGLFVENMNIEEVMHRAR